MNFGKDALKNLSLEFQASRSTSRGSFVSLQSAGPISDPPKVVLHCADWDVSDAGEMAATEREPGMWSKRSPKQVIWLERFDQRRTM